MRKEKYTGPPWGYFRPLLKILFRGVGIESCELRWDNCTGWMYPTFAHSLRRRFISTTDEMQAVILACINCHTELDRLELDETEFIVNEIIKRRPIKIPKVPILTKFPAKRKAVKRKQKKKLNRR